MKRATGEWWEFDGTCSDRALMGGASNVEEHLFTKPNGRFYLDFTDNGRAIRSRLQWSDSTATSAHWEQAYSYDGGKTWDTNWIMQFRAPR